MVSLKLSKKFTRKEKVKAINIIKKGAKEEKSSIEIRKELDKENLSYRKQNELEDIRRTRATIKAKTSDSRERAEIWYDEVYERFRKEHGLNSKQASEAWYRAVTQTAETVEEAELNAEYWDFYHELFG